MVSSLKAISKPIGVSEYRVTGSLPDAMEEQLMSVEDIQKRIKQIVQVTLALFRKRKHNNVKGF